MEIKLITFYIYFQIFFIENKIFLNKTKQK